ncbi:hypothetical protein C6P42_001646 [Pichia californica]|nr:hypothetical protein C6P42_001646 [[Candida] californica]
MTSITNKTVSGPFNVQHIPRTKTIDLLNSSQQKSVSSSISTTTTTQSFSSFSSDPFSSNAIVVATHSFKAEYDNELSCNQGDVFKLVNPKITNGWVLAQSLSSGTKGWVPKDCVKVLDLFTNTNSNNTNNISSVNRSTSLKSKTNSTKSKKNSKSTYSYGSSSNSVLEYYTTPMTPCSSSILPSAESSPLKQVKRLPDIEDSLEPNSSHPICTISKPSSLFLSKTYNSIFTHSMYFLNFSSTKYWYRIDLIFTQNSNQKLHICRYYTDLLTLDKFLHSQAKVFKTNIEIPQLPSPFNFSDNDILLTDHLHTIDQYLKQLLSVLDSQPEDSPLILTFLKFCQPMDNDFEHYVHLDDDQIMKILNPESENSNEENDDIELILDDQQREDSIIDNQELLDKKNNYDDFLFTAPKLKTSISLTSLNSKTSSITTLSSSPNDEITYVKIKIIYKDEFSIIKILANELNFDNLYYAISDKLNLSLSSPFNSPQGFTLAYRNNNGIFILLRDNNGLKKSLLINNRKIIIKVI